ncbi:hypothetical protein [Micromonospora vulcania]|uniref:Serine/threonine protein kinase n=1 Tax=Micromonospora vulcania TaxID=1441873 RepID=A0ABW1H8Y0_9ACTN
MEMAADDRLRSAVLVGVTLTALAVGGWWWRAEAPTTAGSARQPTAEPAVTPTVSTALDRALVVTSDSGFTARVDGETGEIIRLEGDQVVSIVDPATGLTRGVIEAPDEPSSRADPSSELSAFSATIWRERTTLTPGESVIRQSAGEAGNRYLLQVRCTHPGTMLLVVTGARTTGPSRIDCDGRVETAEVTPIGGPIRVSLSTTGTRPVDAEAQLVELP